MKKLTVFVNDQAAHECDRDMFLEQQQIQFLEKMDRDMDRGVKIHGELFINPDERQRATFVAMNLIKALQQENHAAQHVSCAYLVTRLPSLVEIRARDQDKTIAIEFVDEH